MHNDNLEKRVEIMNNNLPDDLLADKEKELREMEMSLPLSEYSTSQLKAELRRRKGKRCW